jgi:hypothetical protein
MQEMEDPGLDELLQLLIDHSIVTYKSSLGLSARWDSVLLLGVFGSFVVCLVLWTIGKVAGPSPPMLWRISLWVYALGLLSAVGLVVGMFVCFREAGRAASGFHSADACGSGETRL